MDDIDIAAIRAWYLGYTPVESRGVIRALCDALDATRAERDELRSAELENWSLIAGALRRAEAAEARIAAALALGHCVACVHEALTWGTDA